MIAIARGLFVGAVGGAAFAAAGVPAPWLAGSMVAAVIAVLTGSRIAMPSWLMTVSFIFLGIQTGTSVTWDTVEHAARWPLSIAFLCLTVVAVTAGSYQFYRRMRGWDGPTALFASLPGALSLVVLLASKSGADMRRVNIAQCIRLFFLVVALPPVIVLLSPSPSAAAPPAMGGIVEIGMVIVAASLAGLALDRIRVPAGLMVGPMVVSAGFELSGIVSGGAPDSLLIPANVILGLMIASRFQGYSIAEFRNALVEGIGGFAIALATATMCAAVASAAAGLPIALTLLAFAPGGLDAMTIMAFALNLDPAYVASHQIVRYVGIVLLMPPVATYLSRRTL